METTNQIILFCGGLLLVSIVAGMLSSRIGAPLLLVFLGLGLLAGEDGPGGIAFDDVEAAYLIASLALAVILFDGGGWRDVSGWRARRQSRAGCGRGRDGV